MANGIFVVDKPAGWTSQDVAAKLRGVFHEKRVGHGGTLDPMATGVLPVFVGRATRAAQFLESADKEYVAGLRLGVVTDTQDICGNVLSQQKAHVTREALEAALAHFTGELDQIPPMYSAVKIGGRKLYELARRGKEVERPARRITIHALEVLDGADDLWTLRVHCSKGTYVRTLCHDIGALLGCGGCMESLRRTRAGAFELFARTLVQLGIQAWRATGSARASIRLIRRTVVPLPSSDATSTESIKLSMTVKPIPERSSPGAVV